MDDAQQTQIKEPNPWMRLLGLAAILVAVVVYFWGPSVLVRFSKGPGTAAEPFVVPSELVYERPPEIPPEQNGFVLLEQACKLMPEKPRGFEFDAAWAMAVDGAWVANGDVENYL